MENVLTVRRGSCLGVGCVAITLLFAVLSPALAAASTYYASGSGSDDNPGTLSQPWRTIKHAEEVVDPGDKVYLRAGTYGAEKTRTTLKTSGTALAPISWLRYPGDAQPTVLGALKVSGSYNRVSGLLFDGPSGWIPEMGEEVLVWLNGDGDELDHSEVRDSAWHAGVYVSNAESFSIDHDYIHDNGVNYNLDHGIYVGSGSGKIQNNLIANNLTWGVQLYPEASNVTVNHNTIVGNGRGGVIVGNEAAENLVVNNIVADNHEYGIRAYSLTGSGNRAIRNLLWNQDYDIVTRTGMTASESIFADPKFVSGSGFRLQSGSPAIEKGTQPTVADDLSGVPRGNPSDLGAYEFVARLPQFLSSSSASTDASTTLTINRPSGVAAGDVLVAEVNNRGGADLSSSGWTQIRDTFRGPSDHMTTFYRVVGASPPSTFTFTSEDPYGKAGGIVAWRNIDAGAPIATSSGNSGSGTTVTASGITTVDPSSPVLFVAGVMDQTTASPPSGFTERGDAASAGTYKATAESASTMQVAAGASGSKSATVDSAGGGWAAQLIALNPVG
jgi:hypothetical protein